MAETKVVNFPSERVQRARQKTDAELSADVRRAWRKLARTIRAARDAGLNVETDFYEHGKVSITRDL